MKYLMIMVLAAALAGCASSGQEAGQGDITQNIRGGLFASYEGNHGNAASTTSVKGEFDGKPVDLQIESAAPFVLNFGEIEANTDAATAGQTADSLSSTPTADVKPTTDLQLTK